LATIHVEDEVDIRRPPSEVFAFVGNHENLPVWTVGVKRATRTTPPPVGVGTRYDVVGRILGRRVKSTYEVTAYEPGRVVAGRMESSFFSFDEEYRFEGNGNGRTRVRLRADARPGGVVRFLRPVLGPALQRQVRADHRRLRTALERRSGRGRTARRRAGPADVEHEDRAQDHHDGGEGLTPE
jgi:uncharacterized membrane protein